MVLPMTPAELLALGHDAAVAALVDDGYEPEVAEMLWTTTIARDAMPVGPIE